jgi:acyl carrier protein
MPPSNLEQDIARLIVESLQLEVDPAEIDANAPLFRTGLGLDSIDALELALAISRRYGIELRADDEQNEKIFGSLRLLANYIGTHRK